MSKTFSLNPSPTFTADVKFPVPGDKEASIKVTYNHKDRDQLDDYLKRVQKMKDIDSAMEVMAGWDLAEEFNRENVEKLFCNYLSSSRAVLQSYISELWGARQGN